MDISANPAESNKIFRDGWFYPGDLGTLNADGLLVITGREQAALNLGGDKISPETIELTLSQFQRSHRSCRLRAPNEYGNNEICAVVVSREKLDEQALRTHCEARMSRPSLRPDTISLDELPHNEMGKLDPPPAARAGVLGLVGLAAQERA